MKLGPGVFIAYLYIGQSWTFIFVSKENSNHMQTELWVLYVAMEVGRFGLMVRCKDFLLVGKLTDKIVEIVLHDCLSQHFRFLPHPVHSHGCII